jgi:3-mercaptopyruvate sulfurtransferase SseA
MKTIILFAAAAFAACNSIHGTANVAANKTTPTAAAQQNEVPRVTTTELEDLIKQGKVVVVDVRTQDMYDKGHIRGARLIPVNQIGERGKELPRDKKIVTYCS